MRSIHLIGAFMRASIQEELAYRANFAISLLNSLLSLGVGVLGLVVLFGQVESLQGWDFSQTLALLGVYLLVSALRGLFIGPSLEALVGLGQEVMTGNFDFTLLRPLDTQFLVTFRHWRLLALVDVGLALGVLVGARVVAGRPPSALSLLAFLLALLCALIIVYAVLLIFTALVFWNPGLLLGWVFDSIFQLARYPVNIYPDWLRIFLTWIVPVGIVTTIPAQALSGQSSLPVLAGSLALAAVLFVAASWLFRRALRRYASASS